MIRIIPIAAAAMSLMLTACDPVVTGDPKIDALLARAQEIATASCGVVIVAAELVQLVPDAAIDTAAVIAAKICGAIKTANRSAALRSSAPTGGAPERKVVRVNVGGNIVHLKVEVKR